MRRFVVDPAAIADGHVVFGPDETRHLARVLRLAPGSLVIATDGRGLDYTVRLESLGERATGTILGTSARDVESPLTVTLVQGVPRGDRMDAVVRAATELGVARILPAVARRTVIRLDAAGWRERERRWQRVAREAAKQCGRSRVPEVAATASLLDCLASERADLGLCLWEGESRPLGAVLAGLRQPPASVALAVGPEGGLDPAEVAFARDGGWLLAGLGPRILRTETAGPAVVAILQATFGDLGRAPCG